FSGSNSTYPVYLTIGNLPKSIHRRPSEHGTVLLGYLSADKIMGSHLFHESMHTILEPLHIAREKGVEMIYGDGSVASSS
ncbi:hypothetical protein JAAARDRAFT_141595, partial [Jaapia argillacea MUCL 33604]